MKARSSSGRIAQETGRLPTGKSRRRPLLVLALFLCLPVLAAGAAAETAPPDAIAKACAAREGHPRSVTEHEVTAAGRRLRYTATAASLEIRLGDGDTKGNIFYVAYSADAGGAAMERPVTFVINGGPGAASAYLHLLALGPRLAVLGAHGEIPAPPARLRDNPDTWLAFTDLVFIDPVGTGYSRADGKSDSEDTFWEYGNDLDSIAVFMRRFLACERRRSSPVFLAGESYGGFRTAALPQRLQAKFGLRLNGVVLISPVLEFSLLSFDAYQPLSWAMILPSYAATAIHHGKSSLRRQPDQPLDRVLEEVENFALGPFLTAVVGGRLPDSEVNAAVWDRVAQYTGLPAALVRRREGRISRHLFARQLLREDGRYVSAYDGTVVAVDPHPAAGSLRAADPVLNPLTALLTRAFVAYAEHELDYSSTENYEVLNPEVSRHWEWGSGRRTRQGYRGVADSLKEAMSLMPGLKVLVTHGYHDLVTPYLATGYTVRQMKLNDTIRGNLTERHYAGGHMFYTHEASRADFFRDARAMYGNAIGTRGKGVRPDETAD